VHVLAVSTITDNWTASRSSAPRAAATRAKNARQSSTPGRNSAGTRPDPFPWTYLKRDGPGGSSIARSGTTRAAAAPSHGRTTRA
jgi:hypothetical protein